MIVGTGPAGHLFSEKGNYKNFKFKVEVSISDKGNSGQYFRTKFAKAFPPGLEAQINSTLCSFYGGATNCTTGA